MFLNSCNSGPFAGGTDVGNPRPAIFASWKEVETYIKMSLVKRLFHIMCIQKQGVM
jgi:hypothetical protein